MRSAVRSAESLIALRRRFACPDMAASYRGLIRAVNVATRYLGTSAVRQLDRALRRPRPTRRRPSASTPLLGNSVSRHLVRRCLSRLMPTTPPSRPPLPCGSRKHPTGASARQLGISTAGPTHRGPIDNSGTRPLRASARRRFGTTASQGLDHSACRGVGNSVTRRVGNSGPRGIDTPGPRPLGHSGPRRLGASGTRRVGTSGPRGLGASGTRHPGASGTRHPGASGIRHLGASACRYVGVPATRRLGTHASRRFGTSMHRQAGASGTRQSATSGTRQLGHGHGDLSQARERRSDAAQSPRRRSARRLSPAGEGAAKAHRPPRRTRAPPGALVERSTPRRSSVRRTGGPPHRPNAASRRLGNSGPRQPADSAGVGVPPPLPPVPLGWWARPRLAAPPPLPPH